MEDCKFCENIQTYEKITKGAFKGGYYPQRNENSIVYDNQNRVFDIWSDGGGDIFMAGVCIDDIKFCPKCGRKLKRGEDKE